MKRLLETKEQELLYNRAELAAQLTSSDDRSSSTTPEPTPTTKSDEEKAFFTRQEQETSQMRKRIHTKKNLELMKQQCML